MEQRKKIKWWKRFIKNIIAVKDKHQVETKDEKNITNSSYDIEIKSVKITDIKIKL